MTPLENLHDMEKLLKLLTVLRAQFPTETIGFTPEVVTSSLYSVSYLSVNGKRTNIEYSSDLNAVDEVLSALFTAEISIYLQKSDSLSTIIQNIRKEINHG